MPHVEIKCFSGRTPDQKQECAKQVATAISKTLGCNISSVSVAIKDVDEADWKSMVWDKQIVPDDKYLYKKPGYSCDEE